ncbi:hypothetical protein BE11_41750 [Sorangium cellulosum]|nr:hypothetical protein BE11_41750 [Sorangium cellulosum]
MPSLSNIAPHFSHGSTRFRIFALSYVSIERHEIAGSIVLVAREDERTPAGRAAHELDLASSATANASRSAPANPAAG